MSERFKNSCLDPVDNTYADYFHIRSTTKGGAGSSIVGYEDLVVPASPNFPPADAVGTSDRYYIYLRFNPDISDIGSTRPWTVTNETTATNLTIITSPGATLTTNQCRIFPATSQMRNLIEIHVGAGSSSASDDISFDGYGDSWVIDADFQNDPSFNTVTTDSDVTVGNDLSVGNDVSVTGNATLTGGVDAGGNGVMLKIKILNIGVWNMHRSSGGSFSVSVAHGLTISKIRSINIQILGDGSTSLYPISDSTDFGGFTYSCGTTNILMIVGVGSIFDSTGFEDNTINRGYITIIYTA